MKVLCTLALEAATSLLPKRIIWATQTVWLMLTLLGAASAQQTASPRAEAVPSAAAQFEVAAIHLHIPEAHEHNSVWSSPFDGRFRAENMSVVMLIHWAYEMPETRIFGAPAWARSTFYNIDAAADPAVDQKLRNLSSDDGRKLKKQMVQTLLADRFQLRTHTETREMPIYTLVVAKGGPRLGEIKSGGTTVNYGSNRLEVEGPKSTALLAEVLSEEVGRPVLDQTGIAGRYDLILKWAPEHGVFGAPVSSNAPPSIFTALQEQLGLKLESQKGPVPVLIVDQVEMPSAN